MTRRLGPFDIVVVGAGSAGCVLANRLSADPTTRVLLLEAGGRDSHPWIHIPVGYLYCMGNPRTDWCFVTEAEPGLDGRALAYPRGRVLGGSSSINGMIYMRGQAYDYECWRQMGLTGWGWDDVLPLFRQSEDHFAGADEAHGAGGELRVERQRLRWELLEAVREAAAQAGIPKTEDFNRGDNLGCGYFQVNQRRGWRWSATKAFLRPVRGRANLTVLTGAHVARVRIEGGRATGVDLMLHGEPVFAAAREVVLSAGAIGSPHLLQLSGIGPAEHLRAHGIDVAVDAPDVGGNLQDHLQLRCVYRVDGVPTLNARARTWRGRAGIGLQYAATRSGPMAMAPSQLGIFARSDARMETADLEWHIQPLSLDRFGEPLHPFAAFTASVCHLRPESRGTVRLASSDPRAPPRIRPNYLSTEGDRRVAVQAIRRTREIVAQEALRRYRPTELRPGAERQEDAALGQAAAAIGTTIFHPVGTARMGTDARAVLDGRLRVRGVAGLRVADASVMPTITSGNTHAPTVMIGEKAAAMLIEDRKQNRP